MSVTWGIALVVLVLSHVVMFAMGVGAYHCLRWINIRNVMAKPQMSEQKLVAMADKLARQQANAAQFDWIKANQMVNGGKQLEEAEESFAPSVKK